MEAPYNFMGLEIEHSSYDTAGIVILPVPFELTPSGQKGSAQGPAAIIDASRYVELFDIETQSRVCQRGICTLDPVVAHTAREMLALVEDEVHRHLQAGKFVATLGGEHTVALGPIRAHLQRWPRLSILHLDAHADRRDAYDDNPYSHACVMARAQEITRSIVSVGVRSVGVEERESVAGATVFYAHEMDQGDHWCDQVIDALGPDVYLTIDLDYFDPSIMPATGTPEPGGPGWYPTLRFLRQVIRQRNLVGLDVTELMPLRIERSSDVLAAKLIYTLLSYRFSSAPAVCSTPSLPRSGPDRVGVA